MKRSIANDPYLWIRKKKGKGRPSATPCPSGYHRAPAYKKFRNSLKYCVRDCKDWKPPRHPAKDGACGKAMKSVWLVKLGAWYKAHKAKDPDYTYKQAMVDCSKDAKKKKKKTAKK
jgi:hypothetical protein